jgi:hypothetical protein
MRTFVSAEPMIGDFIADRRRRRRFASRRKRRWNRRTARLGLGEPLLFIGIETFVGRLGCGRTIHGDLASYGHQHVQCQCSSASSWRPMLCGMALRVETAAAIVERVGIALVYPIPGRPEIPSLWSEMFPRSKMVWSWDADADPRVAQVWHVRERLARTHDVAYAKWFRGRATFFALPVFHALLSRFETVRDPHRGLAREALEILEILRERSPLSTKEIRAAADLRGKAHEAIFQHAMKTLWRRLLVVGTGEVEDGAFPSLAIGATELLFEDLWNRPLPPEHEACLDAVLAKSPLLRREVARIIA